MSDATSDFPPPPRRVRALPGILLPLWLPRLFLLPFILIGIGIAAYALFIFIAIFAGQTVQATVTNVTSSKDDEGGFNYALHYAYTFQARNYLSQDHIEHAEFDRYRSILAQPNPPPGDLQIPIHVFGNGPLHLSEIQPFSSQFAMITIVGGGLNAILCIFIWRDWVRPGRNRWLCRFGVATPGTIVSTRIMNFEESDTYHAAYRYQLPQGDYLHLKMIIPRHKDWQSAKADQQITVLYHPRNPKRSVVYELSGWEILFENPKPTHSPSNPYGSS